MMLTAERFLHSKIMASSLQLHLYMKNVGSLYHKVNALRLSADLAGEAIIPTLATCVAFN